MKNYMPFFKLKEVNYYIEQQKSAENLLNFLHGKNYRNNFCFSVLEGIFIDHFKDLKIEDLVGSDSLQIIYNIQTRVKVLCKKEPDLIESLKYLSENLDSILRTKNLDDINIEIGIK